MTGTGLALAGGGIALTGYQAYQIGSNWNQMSTTQKVGTLAVIAGGFVGGWAGYARTVQGFSRGLASATLDSLDEVSSYPGAGRIASRSQHKQFVSAVEELGYKVQCNSKLSKLGEPITRSVWST